MGQAAVRIRLLHMSRLPGLLLARGLGFGAFGLYAGAAAETLKIGMLGPMSGSAPMPPGAVALP
jgi:hypothetical protein